MSFLKELGGALGGAFGYVVGKPIEFIGEMTDIQILEDIGTGVQSSSKFAGETLGQVTGGAVNTVRGIVTDDSYLRDEGLSDMGQAVGNTAKGVVHTVKGVVNNGSQVIEGAMTGDTDLLKKGASGIATTAAVGAIAFGITDAVINVDGSPSLDTDSSTQITSVEIDQSAQVEPVDVDGELHQVNAHYVEGYVREDGTVVEGYWRDGDGNTSVNQEDGYLRTNPDDVNWNNLG